MHTCFEVTAEHVMSSEGDKNVADGSYVDIELSNGDL